MAFFCGFIEQINNFQFLASVRQKYPFEDVCRHLARITRLFNDYGSAERDKIERIVNSVNFPEFQLEAQGKINDEYDECNDPRRIAMRKQEFVRGDLFWIASYERKCMYSALAELEKTVDNKIAD
ncbi:hypothetical protein HYFRA_00009669 [Hymenoscyphus fraxineus]|uniref:Uncharacterized protein n=1 Tax=Hymenoscyphus fraxineus TaxID=746836 RepID=A0A9N9KTA8_9HELO|nr:hypothetical protein HYFRA_00009669 [Hymenoscyphus fraxineus]